MKERENLQLLEPIPKLQIYCFEPSRCLAPSDILGADEVVIVEVLDLYVWKGREREAKRNKGERKRREKMGDSKTEN